MTTYMRGRSGPTFPTKSATNDAPLETARGSETTSDGQR